MATRLDLDSAQSGDGDSHARMLPANQPRNNRDHKSVSSSGTKDGTMAETLHNIWHSVTHRKVGSTMSSQEGWRAGMRWAAALSAFVLLLNISIAAVAYSLTLRHGQGKAFAPLVTGDCENTKRLGTWIHLGINVLSSLVLGGSNYCLQCLSAPTRKDVDEAHAEGFWLHIGVPNFRNFQKIDRRKFWIWAFLGFSSVPFHLLYNSTFYTTTVTYAYDIYVANDGFTSGASFDEDLFPSPGPPWKNVTIRESDGNISETWNVRGYASDPHEIRRLAMEERNGPFEPLDKDECIQKYANAMLTDRRNLILVVSNSPLDNLTFNGGLEYITYGGDQVMSFYESSGPKVECGASDSQAILTASLGFVTCRNSSLYLVKPWERSLAGNWEADYFQWICDPSDDGMMGKMSDFGKEFNCTSKAAWKEHLGAQPWTVAGFEVDRCLSEKMPGECSLNVGLPLLLTVAFFNLAKLLAIIAAIRAIKEDPLITIGDAVASFIEERDEATGGMCLWSGKEVVAQGKPQNDSVRGKSHGISVINTRPERLVDSEERPNMNRYSPVQSARPFLEARRGLHAAVSKDRWQFASFLLIVAFLVITILFSYAMIDLNRRGNVHSVWEIGIGNVLPETLISGWNLATSGSKAVVQTVLIANLPQLLLSFLYFVINSLFTSMALAAEWNRYGQRRRGLRVSRLLSRNQRTTYFLQLPYRLGVPLLALSVLLHWMVSQSIFFVQIKGKNAAGEWYRLDYLTEKDEIITCGYSPLGMVITLLILVVLMSFAMGLGFRKLAPGIPMAGSCSLAIAAACHVPKGTSELLPVKWGVVSEDLIGDGEGIGHCSFSNDEVESPTVGKMYA